MSYLTIYDDGSFHLFYAVLKNTRKNRQFNGNLRPSAGCSKASRQYGCGLLKAA